MLFKYTLQVLCADAIIEGSSVDHFKLLTRPISRSYTWPKAARIQRLISTLIRFLALRF